MWDVFTVFDGNVVKSLNILCLGAIAGFMETSRGNFNLYYTGEGVKKAELAKIISKLQNKTKQKTVVVVGGVGGCVCLTQTHIISNRSL